MGLSAKKKDFALAEVRRGGRKVGEREGCQSIRVMNCTGRNHTDTVREGAYETSAQHRELSSARLTQMLRGGSSQANKAS